MTDSNGYFSAYYVAFEDSLPYPTEEWKKTLRRRKCLELFRAISVTKNSQLKIT